MSVLIKDTHLGNQTYIFTLLLPHLPVYKLMIHAQNKGH